MLGCILSLFVYIPLEKDTAPMPTSTLTGKRLTHLIVLCHQKEGNLGGPGLAYTVIPRTKG
jgi:hypothetical protein